MDAAIIGAGIGGLTAALRLAHAGRHVEVFDAADQPGGKMRTLPTQAGPVDAGPTVLTMRPVFERLFAESGEALSDHITLVPQDRLARHFWPDGKSLDLYSNPDRNTAAIRDVFGAKSAREFAEFNTRSKQLFDAFEAPMMYAAAPNRADLNRLILRRPQLLAAMKPHLTLAKALARQFSEPQLAQLFGRYATYVGGAPMAAPALLSLIWQAEAGGVWQVKGGMHQLAQSLRTLAEQKGAIFHFNTPIAAIFPDLSLTTKDGSQHTASAIVFNGDPAALTSGRLGDDLTAAVPKDATTPRSHSAYVWSFAAKPSRNDLGLHNVFFGADPTREFTDLANGQIPTDPTLYIYAQDRGGTAPPDGPERFEIIMNAAPSPALKASQGEIERCKTLTFSTLKTMGLSFSPEPQTGPNTLSTPATFNQLFPASDGALYGRSPHGLMAAFKRPIARTRIKGLYLAGGGCHPGAGVPMATLSGMHAAEAILQDQTSTSTSRPTAMPGGMSTGSRMTANTPSPSSAS